MYPGRVPEGLAHAARPTRLAPCSVRSSGGAGSPGGPCARPCAARTLFSFLNHFCSLCPFHLLTPTRATNGSENRTFALTKAKAIPSSNPPFHPIPEDPKKKYPPGLSGDIFFLISAPSGAPCCRRLYVGQKVARSNPHDKRKIAKQPEGRRRRFFLAGGLLV